MSFKFKQDQLVRIKKESGFTGEGKIVGCATNGVVILGANYIVKSTDGKLPNEVYPFDTISVPELFLEVLE